MQFASAEGIGKAFGSNKIKPQFASAEGIGKAFGSDKIKPLGINGSRKK